jgi:hypothetical protein
MKYCEGSPRKAERIFGWNRETVKLGLSEARTGFQCVNANAARCGAKLWEVKNPIAANKLIKIAEEHSQQDPSFSSTIAYTRLSAEKAIDELEKAGCPQEELPSARSMRNILNRMGFKLRRVVKAKPLKKVPLTDDIFSNISEVDNIPPNIKKKRISVDCKATVKTGDFSRGGLTRGNHIALDHDFSNSPEAGSYTPCGIVDEDTDDLFINIGSSFKTSDFIVDSLQLWWKNLSRKEKSSIEEIQIKMDNGPESSGKRTQFLSRIVTFADKIGKVIHLVYYPPYHSKYNPIERCWGILELHWNGAMLTKIDVMEKWMKSMTWKGLHPFVNVSKEIYEKGKRLGKKAMMEIEERLDRNKSLPKYDIRIIPAY